MSLCHSQFQTDQNTVLQNKNNTNTILLYVKLQNGDGNINIIMVVTFMEHLRLHTGAAGENAAELASTGVHVADAFPINSKLELQV